MLLAWRSGGGEAPGSGDRDRRRGREPRPDRRRTAGGGGSGARDRGKAPRGARRARVERERGGGERIRGLPRAAATHAWADGIAERHGHLDGLVHLVGGWWASPQIEEAPPEDWDRFQDLLVRTYQHTTQAFAAHLLASGRGRVVLVSPAQAQAPSSRNASYAAAKAAAEAWPLALADRFRKTGSTANVVVIGGEIVTQAMRQEKPDEDFSKGTPAEAVADAIAYLCGDDAASMNGQRVSLRGAA